eukprot:scaffold4402_cov338-Prasinococcus_capsulatus_cf.AAC.6
MPSSTKGTASPKRPAAHAASGTTPHATLVSAREWVLANPRSGPRGGRTAGALLATAAASSSGQLRRRQARTNDGEGVLDGALSLLLRRRLPELLGLVFAAQAALDLTVALGVRRAGATQRSARPGRTSAGHGRRRYGSPVVGEPDAPAVGWAADRGRSCPDGAAGVAATGDRQGEAWGVSLRQHYLSDWRWCKRVGRIVRAGSREGAEIGTLSKHCPASYIVPAGGCVEACAQQAWSPESKGGNERRPSGHIGRAQYSGATNRSINQAGAGHAWRPAVAVARRLPRRGRAVGRRARAVARERWQAGASLRERGRARAE